MSHMDRSNPAPRSTGLFPPTGGILLGKVLEFLEQSLSSPCPRRDAHGELLAAKEPPVDILDGPYSLQEALQEAGAARPGSQRGVPVPSGHLPRPAVLRGRGR